MDFDTFSRPNRPLGSFSQGPPTFSLPQGKPLSAGSGDIRFIAKYFGHSWCKEARTEEKRVEYCTRAVNDALNCGLKPKKITVVATARGISFRHEKTDEEFLSVPLIDMVCFARHREVRHGKAKLMSLLRIERNPRNPDLPYACHMMVLPTTAQAEEFCSKLSTICQEYAQCRQQQKELMDATSTVPATQRRVKKGWD